MEQDICRQHQEAMELLSEPNAGVEETERLLVHIGECADCAAHWELLGQLRSMVGADLPAAHEFRAMRRAVIKEAAGGARISLGARLSAWFMRPLYVAAVIVAAVGVGLLGGWFAGGSRVITRQPVVPAADDLFLHQLKLAADRPAGIDDIEKAPYAYSNVSIRGAGEGTVDLSFNVTRRFDVTLPKNDPLVAEILVQSLVAPVPVGTRIRAIDFSQDLPSARVEAALIRAMLSDANLGVRLKAQSRLLERPADAEILKALLEVLQTEESVQMRLKAIDYLARNAVDLKVLESAVERRGGDATPDAVYLKTIEHRRAK
ncbi:MAG: hypothetical protein AB1714_01370 [Acidobacteriota bacterium]